MPISITAGIKGPPRYIPVRQGIFLDHLSLVTTNAVFIDYGNGNPKEHYSGLYFLSQGLKVTSCEQVTS